jgi:hypothetical protein
MVAEHGQADVAEAVVLEGRPGRHSSTQRHGTGQNGQLAAGCSNSVRETCMAACFTVTRC